MVSLTQWGQVLPCRAPPSPPFPPTNPNAVIHHHLNLKEVINYANVILSPFASTKKKKNKSQISAFRSFILPYSIPLLPFPHLGSSKPLLHLLYLSISPFVHSNLLL